MLVSYKWLQEYLDLSQVTPKELADKMSVTGIEVEDVTIPSEGLKKIVVGSVEDCKPHPDSDHLSICQVNIGEAELSQIVCGAPNVAAGQKVIVALPGARITGNAKIKKSKMRGEVSNGMICSLEELGINHNVVPKEYSDGIYVLPETAVPGEDVFPILDMDDAIIELSITPNRADALSMHGVAHEVGAIYNQHPVFLTKQLVEDTSAKIENYLSIEVEDVKDAPTYRMRVIKDVTIAPSPLWLQNKLINAGIRPINNVVDVTNYVLLEYGQPMHSFDYDTIGNKKIVVRRGKTGEKLVTLDGEERQLSSENLLITNGETVLGLAGVMGGLDSEITEKTVNVALEAAVFDPLTVRKTSKEFNLRSESSSRFEKGINRSTVEEACDFAAAWIAELSGGQVVEGTIVASETLPKPVYVEISLDRINEAIGILLTTQEVNSIFDALEFVYSENDGYYSVEIPPRRWDITIEADIVEEVARIYGLDRLPSTLPAGKALPGALTPHQALTRKTREVLEGSGLSEAISYVLTTEEKAIRFALKEASLVKLDWPMTEERAVLRQNLISGLLEDLAYNVARKNKDVALYEVGRVFYSNGENILPTEENHVAMAITGDWQGKDWQTPAETVDFYLLKGMLENLLAVYGLTNAVTFEAASNLENLHPGRTAKILLNGEFVGVIGQIHPTLAKSLDLKETYVCELILTPFFDADERKINFATVTKYPAVRRDMALLVDATVTNQALTASIRENGGRFLTDVSLFDVYEGENIASGKKSMAYTLTFQNPEATLVEEEVTAAVAKVTKALTENFAVEVR